MIKYPFNHLFLFFLASKFYLSVKTLYSTYGTKLKNELYDKGE